MEHPPPITWEAAEYEYRERTPDWFWALGIIAVSGAITAILLQDFLFAIVILLAAFAISLLAVRTPTIHRFEINERGVKIGSRLYPYITLESFWIEDRHEHLPPKLLITSKKPLVPHISIPLAQTDPRAVRNFLLRHMQEEEQHESVAHHILEWFGF
jgi:hypothetical protein